MTDERRQFKILYKRFLLRFLDLEILAAQGEMHNLLSQLAAVLAAFSFVLMLSDIRKYAFASDRFSAAQISVAAWGDQEFLISVTMAIVGIFSILMWDTLFPDRRDCLVLSSLPVRMRTIFRAKVTAIAAALGLTALSVNVFTGLVYPFLVIPPSAGPFGFVRSFAAYWATVAAASLFVFSLLLAVQGVMLHLLPHGLFLRVSGYLQLGAFFTVVSGFFLMPSLANPRALADPGSQLQLAAIPAFWFLGLFQELNGTSRPEFAWLAERALWGLAIAFSVAGVTYILAYGSYVRRIIEQSGVVPSDRTVEGNRVLRVVARAFFPQPLGRAIFLFTTRTLVRSRQHRMLMAIYGGIGLSVALVYLRELIYRHDNRGWNVPDVPLLAAITVLLFFIVTGLRICFALPVEPRANWIFRLTEMSNIRVYRAAVQRTLMMLAPVLFWGASAVLLLVLWPWKPAAGHLLIQALFSLLIVSVALGKFRKIPFTCSYLPGKANLKVTLGAYAILILSVADFGIRIELVSLPNLGRIMILSALLIAALRWSTLRATRAIAPPDNRLQFDEIPDAEVSPLDLSSDSVAYRDDTHVEPVRTLPQRLRTAGLIALAVAGAGFVYEEAAGWLDRREYPQIGTRVDIGGRKLNLYCSGQGGPPVLMDAGGNTPGYGWVLVQPELAKFTRACWYDRAGYGWSDPGPLPRTSAAIADDMHALLHAAGIPPPYVLVGHSFGGFNVRLFAAKYPSEVSGLVLVDSAYEREDSIEMPPEMRAPVRRFLPALLIAVASRAYVLSGYLGLMRAFDDAGPARPEGLLSVEQANRLRALRMEPKFIAATLDEARVRAETLSEVRAIHSLGSIPLLVLTAGREPNTREGPVMRRQYVAFQQAWIKDYQGPMARLSTRGRQIIVGNSGHGIPVEAPFAVVDAVRELVAR